MYKYINPSIINLALRSGMIKIDDNSVYVGTTSEVLYIAQNYRDSLSNQEYSSRLENLRMPNVHWAELDKDVFLENVFENRASDGELVIDNFVQNAHISPLHTCNYISLKPNTGGCFWDSTLFNEMFESLV